MCHYADVLTFSVIYARVLLSAFFTFFFFTDTATTEIYTLSLHDALPISDSARASASRPSPTPSHVYPSSPRSEEHTSELQSRRDLVCRLLLEKKKKQSQSIQHTQANDSHPSPIIHHTITVCHPVVPFVML